MFLNSCVLEEILVLLLAGLGGDRGMVAGEADRGHRAGCTDHRAPARALIDLQANASFVGKSTTLTRGQ